MIALPKTAVNVTVINLVAKFTPEYQLTPVFF